MSCLPACTSNTYFIAILFTVSGYIKFFFLLLFFFTSKEHPDAKVLAALDSIYVKLWLSGMKQKMIEMSPVQVMEWSRLAVFLVLFTFFNSCEIESLTVVLINIFFQNVFMSAAFLYIAVLRTTVISKMFERKI